MTGAEETRPRPRHLRSLLRPIRPAAMTSEDRFEYAQFLQRVHYYIYIKAAFHLLLGILYLLVLSPDYRMRVVLVNLVDGLLLIPFFFALRRWPALSLHISIALTAIAISAADAISGYQTSTSGILYALLIFAGAVLFISPRETAIVTATVTLVFLLTYILEIVGIVPVEMTIYGRPAQIRVIGFHALSFISIGVLSYTLFRLYRQLLSTRLERQILSTLLEVFQEISGELDMPTLLQRIVERVVSTIPAADRAILVVREDDRLALRAMAGYGDLDLRGLGIAITDLSGDLWTFHPERLLEVFQARYPEQAQALAALPPAPSIASAPLRVKGTLYGLLVVSSLHADRPLDANARRLLSLLAHQAATALENAHLFAQSRARLQEAEALNRIGREVTGRLEMERLVPEIHRHIQRATDAPFFALALVDPLTGEVLPIYPYGEGRLPADLTPLQQILGEVLRSRRPLRRGDIPLPHSPVRPPSPAEPEAVPTGSFLAVPLLVGQEVVGVIAVGSPRHNAYKEQDERFLSSLASYVAVAIQNARLYDEVQQQARELRRQQRELQEVIETVSRRMIGPVELLVGFAYLLQEEARDRLGETERDYLERIGRNSRWLARLTQDMIFLGRIGQAEEETAPIALSSLIRGVGNNLGLDREGLRFSVQEDMPVLYADPVLMWTLFQHLLEGAHQLLREAQDPAIEVGCEPLPTCYNLYIRGNGASLSPEARERIFDLFFPLGEADQAVGIGMTIAQRIAQYYHVPIRVEADDRGTTFSLLFPRGMGEMEDADERQ